MPFTVDLLGRSIPNVEIWRLTLLRRSVIMRNIGFAATVVLVFVVSNSCKSENGIGIGKGQSPRFQVTSADIYDTKSPLSANYIFIESVLARLTRDLLAGSSVFPPNPDTGLPDLRITSDEVNSSFVVNATINIPAAELLGIGFLGTDFGKTIDRHEIQLKIMPRVRYGEDAGRSYSTLDLKIYEFKVGGQDLKGAVAVLSHLLSKIIVTTEFANMLKPTKGPEGLSTTSGASKAPRNGVMPVHEFIEKGYLRFSQETESFPSKQDGKVVIKEEVIPIVSVDLKIAELVDQIKDWPKGDKDRGNASKI